MPSLNRIILINTHLKGVVELIVDDHTNICGTNASGKTTLQRLVPVFYGEYPSRVVPATRDSFERWYLPTEQSFIIYEYRCMDGQLCQAVLAAAADGKGVAYRLARKAFELQDYIKTRQGNFLTFLGMAELGRQLKQSGVATTKLLNTRQFRAIIQNDRSLLGADSDRGEMRAYARQFSLCEAEHSLRHIEKLARAVHSREGKMETVKSMIATILEEDGVNPPASGLNLQRVEAWIRESRLIQGFNAIRPKFDKLQHDDQDLRACELRLSGLLHSYQVDESLQWKRQEDSSVLIEQTGFELKQLDECWKQQRDELNQELSAAKGDNKRIEAELDRIENQYQAFLDSGIEQAKIDLELIPAWRDDLDNLQARHRLLTEQHQDVEAAYKDRCQEIKDRREMALEQLRGQQDALQEERTQQHEQQTDALAALEQGFHQRRQQGQDEFHTQELQLKVERNRLEQQIDNSGHTEEENRALAIFEQRLERADEELEASAARVKEEEIGERQRRARRDAADHLLRQANRRLEDRQSQLDELKRVLYPGHYTLLEFLRREQPGWEEQIGKVVHPELLQRTDLKPTLTEHAQATLFGVLLDLSALETPEHAASEQTLRQRWQCLEDEVQEAKNQQQFAEKQLIEANEAVEDVQQRLLLSHTEQRNRREDIRRIKEEKRNQQEQINAALQERKLKARKQLTELTGALKQLASQHEQWLADLKNQHGADRLEKTAYWQQVLGSLYAQIQQLKKNIEQRQSKAQQELKECENWYKAELHSRGVDENVIVSLKRELDALNKKIATAEQRRSDVHSYADWYQHHWLQRKPLLQTESSESQLRATTLEQQLAKATAAFKAERSRLEELRMQAAAAKTVADELLTRLRTLLHRLKELKLPPEGSIPDGELHERLRLGENLLQSREQLLAAIKAHVEHFDTLIAGQSGSSLAETWERSREECTLVGERGIPLLDHRKLVPHLEQLLNVMVPQSIMALREQGRIFGLELNNYYDVLVDIDRSIVTQSIRITREVSEELFLDGVSDSAVRIRSRISELEFWPELKAFIKAFQQWRTDGFNDLPGEDYTSSMRRALDIIGRSALSGGIAGLLEIELRLREGNSDLVIRTDRQLNESSSHGMAYLILCKFLLAFTRLLRGASPATIHWPIDEIGTLHHTNVKKIFDACSSNNIRVLGAFPNPDSDVLSLFANRYIVNKQTKQLQIVKPKMDAIAEKLQQRQAQETI
ncbi:ATP-binding protein [Azomonas macrocytogenes]|uniref:ATP-binding protein n=1 Tax=Azomonas macrocytogenes TaxID=69962 RepID=A0A839T5E2_AZOMA|nr:ATP-binding protein [Azomonas macrocytogenes]MBB3103990.1 hypothetical protein [Azomonas macrocytogenes]